MWVLSFDCVSYVNVYVVLVCGHFSVSAWLLLHVYVLVDVLGLVIVFFQSGAFEYILTYLCWGGAVVHIFKKFFVRGENFFGGRSCEERLGISTFPLAVFVKHDKSTFIPEDNHAKTNLDNHWS